MSLKDAAHEIERAVRAHQSAAAQCQAVYNLIGTILRESDEPMPVLELARALKPLGLCILHRGVVVQALDIVASTDDAEGLSGYELHQLQNRLQLALDGES
jgi:hypothetical protein